MLGGDGACRRCGWGIAWCVSVCVEAKTGLCLQTKNSVAFVVTPIHFGLCQNQTSELSNKFRFNTEDIMHLPSPPPLSWDGVLPWALVWPEELWEEPVLDVEVNWGLRVAVVGGVFGGSDFGAEVDDEWVSGRTEVDVFVDSVVFVFAGAAWATCVGLVGREWDVLACVVNLSVWFLLLSASVGMLVSTERERDHYAIILQLTTSGKDTKCRFHTSPLLNVIII